MWRFTKISGALSNICCVSGVPQWDPDWERKRMSISMARSVNVARRFVRIQMIRPTLSCQTIEAEKCLAVNSVRCCLWNDSRCYKAIVRQSFLWRGTLGRCWTQAARWRTRPPPPPVRWLTGPILLIQTATLINKWRKLNEPQGLDHNFFSFILQKHKQRKYWIKWIRRKQTEKVSLIYSPTEGTCQKKAKEISNFRNVNKRHNQTVEIFYSAIRIRMLYIWIIQTTPTLSLICQQAQLSLPQFSGKS